MARKTKQNTDEVEFARRLGNPLDEDEHLDAADAMLQRGRWKDFVTKRLFGNTGNDPTDNQMGAAMKGRARMFDELETFGIKAGPFENSPFRSLTTGRFVSRIDVRNVFNDLILRRPGR